MSEVDEALDRLDAALLRWAQSEWHEDYPAAVAALATVRSDLERLREELRVITNERDELYEANWPWEWVIATREKERRQAAEAERDRMRHWAGRAEVAEGKLDSAEAEVQRLTEGLRRIAEDSPNWMEPDAVSKMSLRHQDEARALLAASPGRMHTAERRSSS